MKFLIFSDSHRYTNAMDIAIEKHKDITHIIHCGDVNSDYEYLEDVYGYSHAIAAVSGNNDFFTNTPLNRLVKCAGHIIFVTHGHKENVKSSLLPLVEAGKSAGASMCIFGHTHTQFFEEIDGIKVLNPGSINHSSREYAIIEVTKQEIKVELHKL